MVNIQACLADESSANSIGEDEIENEEVKASDDKLRESSMMQPFSKSVSHEANTALVKRKITQAKRSFSAVDLKSLSRSTKTQY